MKQWIVAIFRIGLLIIPVAHAERWYQVEVIVFSHVTAQALNSEQWPTATSPPFPMRYAAYPTVPRQTFQLQYEEKRLRHQPGFAVLLHQAWRQPIMSHRTSGVHLLGDSIDGTIAITLQHYFDVDLHLTLALPRGQLALLTGNNYFDRAIGSMVYFPMFQSRRMRSHQLNYIDFPLAGALRSEEH